MSQEAGWHMLCHSSERYNSLLHSHSATSVDSDHLSWTPSSVNKQQSLCSLATPWLLLWVCKKKGKPCVLSDRYFRCSLAFCFFRLPNIMDYQRGICTFFWYDTLCKHVKFYSEIWSPERQEPCAGRGSSQLTLVVYNLDITSEFHI